MIRLLFPILFAILFTAGVALTAKRYVHMLQLEGYKNLPYLIWLKKNSKVWLRLGLPLVCAVPVCEILAAVTAQTVEPLILFGIAALLAAVFSVLSFIKTAQLKAKKPLVFTSRVKRLYAIIIVLAALVMGLLLWLLWGVFRAAYGMLLALALTPLIVCLANFAAQPLEWAVKQYYIRDAVKKLNARKNMIKIGITGSYGKTSAKFALGTILSEKYNTLVTPESYNTPMGLCRTIREHMKPEHEVFVAEMGARHVGDIQELCDMVHPTYGLITSIGKQHLETFGSLENIIKTKYSLIESLPQNGVAFLPDTDLCYPLYRQTSVQKALFGLDPEKEYDITAKDIAVGAKGSTFRLVAGNEEIECSTRLLGMHNIMNILGACAVARALGLTMEQIASGIAKIAPVPHRLQLLDSGNGVIVVDDAFNSNPAGTQAAMDVLSRFEGRKIVVTPGMVELGKEEEAQNRLFGQRMAQVADFVILVGPQRTKPIAEGMLAEGFPKESMFVVRNIEEATACLGHLTRVGDVVLFENDLPDNYNEN